MAESRDGIRPGFWAELTLPAGESERHDFHLRKEVQDHYSIVFLADMHLISSDERNDLQHFDKLAMPLIEKLNDEYSAKGPVYSLVLGDTSHELYWYQYDFDLSSALDYLAGSKFPFPIYAIPGNHDNDGAITGPDTDFRAGWLYRKIFGPEYYSLDIGGSHWIMMDDIIYKNTPGKGKKSPGIAGARDYDNGFTDKQLEWMRRDLEFVGDTTPVYLCTHSPILYQGSPEGILLTDRSQMDSLDGIFAKFDKVTVFSGHAHLMMNLRNEKYPRFEQYVLSATSGNIWETSTNGGQALGMDGSDAGILVGTFSGADAAFTYHTEKHGIKMLRAYDMNAVGKYYRTDPNIRLQQKIYAGSRVDYGKPEYENCILVNYWCSKPGQKVEIYEDGKPLEISLAGVEDPLYNISYYIPALVKSPEYKKSHAHVGNTHMFVAKASTPDMPVEIRILGESGELIHSEIMVRPKEFDIDME